VVIQEAVLAVLVIFRTEGDPPIPSPAPRRDVTRATAQAPVRPEAHFCVPTTTGIMIVDVWRSREDLRRGVTANSAFQAVWQEAGWPNESVEDYDIHGRDWPAEQPSSD
jgi:hypothetical protein